MQRIEIYDTTLRDGAQGEGVSFSVQDKLLLTERLESLGFDYLEGGYPASNEKDAEHFRRVIDQHNIVRLVVGLPVHTSGREGTKAREARRFGGWLANVTGLPVVFWDERFTTVEAERYLQQAELTAKKRKARRDMLAAQILLQSYLDAGAPASDQAARSAAALDDLAN